MWRQRLAPKDFDELLSLVLNARKYRGLTAGKKAGGSLDMVSYPGTTCQGLLLGIWPKRRLK